MAALGPPNARARTFFLNEQHELAHAEKAGGGGTAKYGTIDWVAKARNLGRALQNARVTIAGSQDPLRDRHYFLVARPEPQVPKISESKNAPGEYLEDTEYDGIHSRVFRRLGMDLLEVARDGTAAVHATTERLTRLYSTALDLAQEGPQEQSRWATIKTFEPIPARFRLDDDWFATLRRDAIVDVVVELQPLLTRIEVEEVLSALVQSLSTNAHESVWGTGADFSGRRWLRARVRRPSVRRIADTFFSVQSLHPPFTTAVAALTRGGRRATPAAAFAGPPPGADLPTVAVVDTGIPEDHPELSAYVRSRYRLPDAPAAYLGSHGSLVASRIIFGDLNFDSGVAPRAAGECRVVDVMVADGATSISDKAVLPALEAIVGTSPDVRVFNLSFGDESSLASYPELEQRERLLLVQDLDNFVFARDVIVVMAAGNSPRGIVPARNYPHHLDEPAWQLGAWPSGFNTLTCGATAELARVDTLTGGQGWPSPFTRVGPGVASAPVPDFGAHGGDVARDWQWRGGLGVWGCTADGTWEDHLGTSFAAPLLAREAAFAFKVLQGYCAPGARPFAATVKSFLAATSTRRTMPEPVELLAARTIGHGTASSARLRAPRADSALFLWQGVIAGTSDIARVQLPIPLDWLKTAQQPWLRLVVTWDAPVNEAVRKIWACRKIVARLRPKQEARALQGTRADHPSYPMIDRWYDLSRARLQRLKATPTSDNWMLELLYEQVAEYYAGLTFSPQQRVAFTAELVDRGAKPHSPQPYVQALPAASTMTRLSVPPTRAPAPIVVKTGV